MFRIACRMSPRAKRAAGSCVALSITGIGLGVAVSQHNRCQDGHTRPWFTSPAMAEAKAFLLHGYGETTHGTYDVCVVGGGIVGVATARQIAKQFPDKSVVVVEKEKNLAAHQTGHNSGVIHAGIYYKPGSHMAQCCVDGARMMYEYCEANGVPCERVGKLIVATDKADYPVLEQLLERGKTNGVQGLEILDREAIRKLEPNVGGYAALHSPNTGICDFAEAARSFAKDLVNTGRGEVLLNYEVTRFETVDTPEGKIVEVVGAEPGQWGPQKKLRAKAVITCAGLQSDKVSILGGGSKKHRITPFRGRYVQMKEGHKDVVARNIYPVPNNKAGIAVGIHFTPTIDNSRGRQLIVGPGCCMAFAREGYKITDFSLKDMVTSLGSRGLWLFVSKNFKMGVLELYRDFSTKAFVSEAQKMVPSLRNEHIEPSFSGVMAQLFIEDGTTATDFIYEVNDDGNMIHLRNAPSPACTASLAIAQHIANYSAQQLKWG